MNARRAPGWVLRNHLEDQFPNALWDLLPPDGLPVFGDQSPKEAETSPVPPDHRLGRDDYENLFPSGAKPSRPNPEEPIEH